MGNVAAEAAAAFGSSSASSSSSASNEKPPGDHKKAQPFILLDSQQLPGPTFRSKSIYLVIYGGSVTAKFLSTEIAPHIGLLIGNAFADFETYARTAQLAVVDQLYPKYGQAKYYRLPVILDTAPWDQIKRLSDAFCKYNQAAVGTHSKWPYNCRSFVAAVLFHIMKVPAPRLSLHLPGLGLECQLPAPMDALLGHMQTVLAGDAAGSQSKKASR